MQIVKQIQMVFKMSQEEIYTKEEYYQDWKNDNLSSLREEFIAECLDRYSDDFEAYCRQMFKDRD